MQIIKLCPLFLVLILAESINVSRQNVDFKKDARSKVKKRGTSREMFPDLFQVYDASFLAAVWPKIKNGVHLMLDVSCWKDMSVFFKDLSEGKYWAYSAVDASGHYESGFFSGNRLWLGSKEQCDRLDDEYVNSHNQSSERLQAVDYATEIRRSDRFRDYGGHDWRWVLNHNELKQGRSSFEKPPIGLAYTVVELALNISKFNSPKIYNVVMGICVPCSCTNYDIESIVNFSIMINENLKSNRTLPRTSRIVTVRKIKDFDVRSDFGGIFFIGITLILSLLGTVATIIDLRLIKCTLYNRNSMSFDLEKYNKHNQVVIKGNKIVNELKCKVDKATNIPTIKPRKARIIDNTMPVAINNILGSQTTGNCQRCGKYRQQCNSSRPSVHSPSPPARDNSASTESGRSGTFCRLLLCFSFVYSWKRIFNKNTANKDLSLTHSLKIIATFCVMFVHVSIMVNYISVTAITEVAEHSNVFNILIIGTVAFDTLFFVSGLISSHHFFYLKSRYSVEELVSFGGRCGQILQFFCFVTNRIVRLLPPYAYAILLSAVLARVLRDTAVLTLPDGDHRNCNSYWWRNLIYVSNMYPENQQCMQISWYLSTETQLHAVGALACAASVSANALANVRAKIVASVAFAVMLAATTADVSAAYFDDKLLLPTVFGAYSSMIDRPLARVAPYFIGVFSGWLIHATRTRFNISKTTSGVLWVISIALLCLTWSLPLVSSGSWPAAFVHATWPLGLLYPVLLCSTKHADVFRRVMSSGSLSAVSRLCYGALLLHGAAARALLLGTGTAACSSMLCLWIYYTATSVLTLLAALLLSLLVEMPCCSLLRRLSDCATT